MNKILSIILLILIGGAIAISLVIAWILGFICLLLTEIIGTKKFAVKFYNFSKVIADEFKDTLKGINSLFVESK